MNPFQWLFFVFCVVQLCVIVLRFRRSRLAMSLILMVPWVAAVVVLLDPNLATLMAKALGIGRGADLIIYTMSFVFLWGHYQHYLRYKQIEHHITSLVRELAIERSWERGTPPVLHRQTR